MGAVLVGSGGNATNRAQRTDGDLPVLDQLRDVRQRQDSARIYLRDVLTRIADHPINCIEERRDYVAMYRVHERVE